MQLKIFSFFFQMTVIIILSAFCDTLNPVHIDIAGFYPILYTQIFSSMNFPDKTVGDPLSRITQCISSYINYPSNPHPPSSEIYDCNKEKRDRNAISNHLSFSLGDNLWRKLNCFFPNNKVAFWSLLLFLDLNFCVHSARINVSCCTDISAALQKENINKFDIFSSSLQV